MSDYDVSVLPLIPSAGDIGNLHAYLNGPSASPTAGKSPQDDSLAGLDSRISGFRSREALYALRNPKKSGSRVLVSPSTQSAPSSLYHYGMPRNYSTPSLRGVKSVSPVPMSDSRPRTVTPSRMMSSPTPALDDSQSTPTLLPRRIRKSRSASLLSFRKSGSRKNVPPAGSPPLPEAARMSPTPMPVSALGLYHRGSSRADNTTMSMDLHDDVGNDSSTMLSLQEELHREVPDTPKSMASSLHPPLSTTSGSSNEVFSKSPASAQEEQESLKILADIGRPWFKPSAPPPLPTTLAPRATPTSGYPSQPEPSSAIEAPALETNPSNETNESLWHSAWATPSRPTAPASLHPPSYMAEDASERLPDADSSVSLRPGMTSIEYSPVSRYSGLSQMSPQLADVPSYSPAASFVKSPLMPSHTLANESPVVLPRKGSLRAADLSLSNGLSDNKSSSSLSVSPHPQGLGLQPQPATHNHTLSSTSSGPKFTYSIVHGIQPKSQQRHTSNSSFHIPIHPSEPSQSSVNIHEGEQRSTEPGIVSTNSPSSLPPPILPNILLPKVLPPLPQPETDETTLDSREPQTLMASSSSRADNSWATLVHDRMAEPPTLADKFENWSGMVDSSDRLDSECNASISPFVSTSTEAHAPARMPQPRKSSVDESISLRLKEFQSQQDTLRGTIETSRAEILQLREKIRAFRAEVDEGAIAYAEPSHSNVSIYPTVNQAPTRSERIRDSLVSMDDLDRRLTQMLESHDVGDP